MEAEDEKNTSSFLVDNEDYDIPEPKSDFQFNVSQSEIPTYPCYSFTRCVFLTTVVI
jgi:hypothetical protein